MTSACSSSQSGRRLLGAWTFFRFKPTSRLADESWNRSSMVRIVLNTGIDVLKDLSARLTAEVGAGFSRSNLEYMRRVFLAYPQRTSQIPQTASGISYFPDHPIRQTPSGTFHCRRGERPFLPQLVPSSIPAGAEQPGAPLLRDRSYPAGWTLREREREYMRVSLSGLRTYVIVNPSEP